MTTMRQGRLPRSLVAMGLATTLLAGCGSKIEPTAAGPNSSVVQGQTGATDTAPDNTAPAPAGSAAADTAAAAPQAATTAAATTAPAAKGGKSTGKTSGSTSKAGTTASTGTAKTTTGGAAPVNALNTAVATLPIFGGSGTCKPATLSPVNVGNVSTLSGVLGELHQPGRFALEAFVQSQNACGGLNGHKINLFQEDDQGDPTTAASKIQALAQKHIIAFVGNIESLTIDGALPAIKKAGIPVIGGDIVSNTWFTNPLLFPQGSPPQAVSYEYAAAAKDHFHATKEGHMWCLEVPRACEQLDRAWKELAPGVGVQAVTSTQMSITSPSYVQQCLDFKSRQIEVVALSMDAASMARIARSCNSVGYHPKWIAHPLGLGNETQFLGLDLLGGTYVPLNVFPWMGNSTPAEKYWQRMHAKYTPGRPVGGAASSAWTAGALLVAAASGLSADNPTSAQLLATLYTFQGQAATTLGGLTVPLTYHEGKNPTIPYCTFAAIANAKDDGWDTPIDKAACTKVLAPSDPQAAG